MAAWIYGSATPIGRRGDVDAYGVFYRRASERGWLTDAIRPNPTRLWGMNDAVLDLDSGEGPRPAGWFQVVVTDPDPIAPVQPFLACVSDTLAELVRLELESVQLLLPAPLPGAASASSLRAARTDVIARHEAEDVQMGLPLPVIVDVEGGSASNLAAGSERIVDAVRSISTGGFECTGVRVGDATGDDLPPGLVDGTWGGPSRYQVSLSGTVRAWSLPVIGGLSAVIALGCLAAEVRSPCVISVRPSRSDLTELPTIPGGAAELQP